MKQGFLFTLLRNRLKCIAIIFCCILIYFPGRAQFVPIPDGNFLNWLSTSNVGVCLNGFGQLDTTCQALLQDTVVSCPDNEIYNLEGIEYFKNLRYLDCSVNFLDSLPPLPDSLRMLRCFNNSLVFLPALPLQLRYLYCATNQLHILPTLPVSLITLYCSANPLDSLPTLPSNLDSLLCSADSLSTLPSFPNSLQYLFCEFDQLTTLPTGISLRYVDCSFNQINALPIYDSLQVIDCEYNQLSRLPVFPNTLTTLFCAYNNIDSIIYLPNSLSWIECQYNQLKSLGTQLPSTIGYLDCSYNLLTVLPPLPITSMVTLACQNNLLTELPDLPEAIGVLDCFANPNLRCLPKLTNIDYLEFDSTAITCIPNYGNVANSIPPLDSMPLCGLNNPKGCLGYTSISQINSLGFSIYPNPACNYTLLTTSENESDLTLQVFDATGKEWIYTRFNSNYELPVKQLPDGLYFLKISNGQGDVGVRKLVVVR